MPPRPNSMLGCNIRLLLAECWRIGRDCESFLQNICRFCPFAQRTWIALNEKTLTFETHEVAIKDPATGLWKQIDEKPAWLLKLNPLGKARPSLGPIGTAMCPKTTGWYALGKVIGIRLCETSKAACSISRSDEHMTNQDHQTLSSGTNFSLSRRWQQTCQRIRIAHLQWVSGGICPSPGVSAAVSSSSWGESQSTTNCGSLWQKIHSQLLWHP